MHQEDKHFDRCLIRSRLKDFEGVVLQAYECSAGYTSIGIGRNLDTRGITEDEAMYLLNNDIPVRSNFESRSSSEFVPSKGLI